MFQAPSPFYGHNSLDDGGGGGGKINPLHNKGYQAVKTFCRKCKQPIQDWGRSEKPFFHFGLSHTQWMQGENKIDIFFGGGSHVPMTTTCGEMLVIFYGTLGKEMGCWRGFSFGHMWRNLTAVCDDRILNTFSAFKLETSKKKVGNELCFSANFSVFEILLTIS